MLATLMGMMMATLMDMMKVCTKSHIKVDKPYFVG